MELVANYLDVRLMIIVVFLYIVGLFLKQVPWFKANWAIPILLWMLGIFITFLYTAYVLGDGLLPSTLIVSIIQGTLTAAMAVFGYEIIKQITHR